MDMTNRLRRAAAALLASSALTMAALPAHADGGARNFDIAAQEAPAALNEFARQAEMQILFPYDAVSGKRVPPVRGAMTAETALQTLLDATGLVVVSREGNTITLGLRAAAADDDSSGGGRATDGDGKVERVVVTGTHIRGKRPESSPVNTYTAEDIERTGATTTDQFIQKLPQSAGTRTQFATDATAARNLEGVNSVDLRGLGVGTTLTLVNGRRFGLSNFGQAADVSLIPLSAIERVEVLSDGASAVYGSDAIGGVVNFVLRSDFEGAESRVGYGTVTSGGLKQFNASQIFGAAWGSGNGLVAYDYFDASPLLRTDRSYSAAAGPGTTLAGLVRPTLTPNETRSSGLATLAQDVGDRLTLSADFLLSSREVANATAATLSANPLLHSFTEFRSDTEQYFTNVGADFRISDDLNLSVNGSYADVDVDSTTVRIVPASSTVVPFRFDANYSAFDLTAMLDGTLFTLPGGDVRFSIGAGRLNEDYRGARTLSGASNSDLGRTTTYSFGELLFPIVSDENAQPLLHRLEVSVAARYTKYDDASDPALNQDFDGRTSPKVGVLWGITDTFRVRGTYGESFRAPSLTEVDPASALVTFDPFFVAGAPSLLIGLVGSSPELLPETAKTYTLGADFQTTGESTFRASATYFKIDYVGRLVVGDPTFGAAPSANPAAFPEIIFRPTSAAQVEEFLRYSSSISNTTGIDLSDLHAAAIALYANPDLWLYDNRLRNLAGSVLDGIDLSVDKQFQLGSADLAIGAQATWLFDYKQQLTPSSQPITVVDTALRPADLRGRMYVNLSLDDGFSATVGVNYVDNYSNPFAIGGAQPVDSWTTVDLHLSYAVEAESTSNWLDGMRFSVSAQNLFDEDPPFVGRTAGQAVVSPVGFDPANANPLGRFVSVTLSRAW